MDTRRTQKVGEAMREALGDLIQRQVKDPRVGFVTITAVRVTADLAKADVYYTVLGEGAELANTQAGLESAAPFLRTEAGRRVRLKTLPELHFHLDDTPEKGQRVDSIIEEIHRADATDPLRLPPVAPEIDRLLRRAVEVLEDASSIGIACHIAPDGDALGSLLACAMAFTTRGIDVQATWDGPEIVLPAQYDFLPGADLLIDANRFRPPEVALAVDCANPERLGRLWERMSKASAVVNIDHHVSNTKYAAVNVIDDGAVSTAELVLQLLVRMGAEITPEIATCLYTGLVTDAGRFSYSSVTPRTHATAAFLIQRGVAVDEVSQALFESFPFSYLKILGRALDRAWLEEDPTFVASYLTQEDLSELGVTMDDTDELINTLRAVRDADVTCLLKELDDGSWKGSLRSKGSTDVGSAAQALGGGGHRLAAGWTSDVGRDETFAKVREALSGR